MSKKKQAPPTLEIISDPVEAAKAAALRYVNASELGKGITRVPAKEGFTYRDNHGHIIHDEKVLARIRSLAIPPAWTDVWICPTANGHIQAIGRDAKGRKQYRYHPNWRNLRSETKYTHMIPFGEALPKIRQQVEQDLKKPGLSREKVLALVIRLLETTFIRIGNPEYARNNKSFGLTTLRDRHVDVSGSEVKFHFRGKSGKDHTITLQDRRLAAIIRRCKDIPGQDLFQYIDESGTHHPISSTDVNAYLHEIAGQEFNAKDFRTWGGTVLGVKALQELGPAESQKQAKKNVKEAIKIVAEQLGNTPAVCWKYYLHPAIIESYSDGSLFEALERCQKKKESTAPLHFEERVVMDLLQQHVHKAAA